MKGPYWFGWKWGPVGWLRWRYSPFWRGYRAGLATRHRAHQKYLELQKHFD